MSKVVCPSIRILVILILGPWVWMAPLLLMVSCLCLCFMVINVITPIQVFNYSVISIIESLEFLITRFWAKSTNLKKAFTRLWVIYHLWMLSGCKALALFKYAAFISFFEEFTVNPSVSRSSFMLYTLKITAEVEKWFLCIKPILFEPNIIILKFLQAVFFWNTNKYSIWHK